MAENLKFLDVNSFVRGLTPVTFPAYLTRTGEFHPQGLFSESIFGPVGATERKKTFSYIELSAKVIHPLAFKILTQFLDRKIEKFLSATSSFSLDKNGVLIETDDGVNGILEFIKMFPKINFRGDTKVRESYINLLKKSYANGTLFIDKIPVIPPDLRPATKDIETNELMVDALNEFYITIIKRSIQIKSVEKSGTFFDILNHYLQKSVNEHSDFIQTKLGKKSGLIRHNLMGKRVDFSARAVITSGPELNVDEIGLPLSMAVELFKPFLIHVLLYTTLIDKESLKQEISDFTGIELSVDSIERVIRAIKNLDKIPDKLYELFFTATQISMTNRIVLAKRDPMLHPEGIRALRPVLVRGNTLQICTLQVGGYSADFDGDQMAVFHPLTNEAQEEAKKRMMRANTGNSPTISFELSKEMCVGLYIITKDVSLTKSPISVNEDDLKKATDPYIPVVYKGNKTTMGKAIFNSCLPEQYPFVSKVVNRGTVNSIIKEINNKFGEEIAKDSANKLKNTGFKFATIMSPSITLEDTNVPLKVKELKSKLKGASTEDQIKILGEAQDIMKEKLKKSSLGDLVESGSTRGWDQSMQVFVAKGVISDVEGNVLPAISGSFSEGLTPTEYFKATAGARKGIIDRVLNTADTGYTSRQLAYLLNSVEIDLYLKDCKTDKYLEIKLTDDIISRLNGRFVLKMGKIVEFNKDDFKEGDIIKLRSPIYCRSPKICHTCYGRLLERHKSPYAGILAAQKIGERGTQLIMRTFHTGGAAKISVRNIIQEILDNDPLVSENQVKRCFIQQENSLICTKPCKIIIEMSDYEVDNSFEIKEEEGKIWVKSLLSTIEFQDVVFNLILDYPVELHFIDMVKEGKEKIILTYEENDTILDVQLEKKEMKEQVLYVKRLLSGREIYKDNLHLLMKIYKIYGPIASDMDLVHLEVLASQCFRDKVDPSIPARLGKNPDDPSMVNIKTNIFNTGFLQGLAFENIGQAIRTGLITEQKMENSILEKVLTGEILEIKEEEYD